MGRLFVIFICVCCIIVPLYAAGPDGPIGGDTSDDDGYYPDVIQCAIPEKYVKCAKFPEYTLYTSPVGGNFVAGSYVSGVSFSDIVAFGNQNWSHIRNGVPIVGNVERVDTFMRGPFTVYTADCRITSPYSMIFYAERSVRAAMTDVNYAEICANVKNEFAMTDEQGILLSIPTALDGDVCPDGFFTVPYESWCGEGMVNIADVPNCEDDMSGEYCLAAAVAPVPPCGAGISKIRTSTGISVPLFAEKSTSPSLAVKYNDVTCWANLAPGTASGTINVEYNGQAYHAQTE